MNARRSSSGYRASRPSVTAVDFASGCKVPFWCSIADSAESYAFLPSSSGIEQARLPFVYPSGAFNGGENTAFPTGCLLANPSESEGSSTVPSNFCSQMAARRPLPSLLLSSLLFHETHSFLRWCCSGGPSFLPSFRTAAAAMDFSLGAHFIKNRST